MDYANSSENIQIKKAPGFFSKVTFWWTLPVINYAYKKHLTERDLNQVLEDHESGKLGDKLETAWRKEVKTGKPSLWKALYKIFKYDIWCTGIVIFIIELFIRLGHPLFLGKLMIYFIPGQNFVTKSEAFLYSALIILTSTCNVVLGHNFYMATLQLGMKVRIATSSLIYRKLLRFSRRSMNNISSGQIIQLISSDTSRFDHDFIFLHLLWVAPLQIGLMLFLLFYIFGFFSLIGVAFIVMCIPLEVYLGSKLSEYRLKTVKKTEERVRLMSEIIRGIQVIKMYAWEKPFIKLVEVVRKLEVREYKFILLIRAFHASMGMYVNRIAIFACLLVFVLMGNIPDAYFVFVLISFYNVLRVSMVLHFPHAITSIAEVKVSIRRIQRFLLYEELQQEPQTHPVLFLPKFRLNIINGTAKWDLSLPDNTLNNINFQISPKEKIAIVGIVGSGKSSLLQVLLKELPLSSGSVEIKGSISYASQEPWIFPGSIQQNIIFGQALNINKYNEVLRICALEEDLLNFPFGDKTIIGERGVTLSGGQKARINLARSIYRDADVYLLDDPLSSVDVVVGKYIFSEAFVKYLKNKTLVLVTHQTQYLSSMDRIYMLNKGSIVFSGKYPELLNSGEEVANYLEDEDREPFRIDFAKETAGPRHHTNASFNPLQIEENIFKGSVKKKIYKTYIAAAGSKLAVFLVIFMFILSEIAASGTDYFNAFWVNDLQKQSAFLTVNAAVLIYSTLILGLVGLTMLRSFAFVNVSKRACENLHSKMLNSLMRSELKFFHRNSPGRILNRFSKDIWAIDEILPLVTLDTLQIGLTMIAILSLIIFINPWMAAPAATIVAILFGLRKLFVRATRNFKRLDGSTRSPIFIHFNSTLQGLTTIRACRSQEILFRELDKYQNLHTSAYFLLLATNRAFGFWVDMVCIIFLGIVTFSFLWLESKDIFGANVGLAVTQAIRMTGTLQWGMRQWNEFENQMTSVERIVEYIDLKPESTDNVLEPQNWPKYGSIHFSSVYMKYFINDPYILKDLNFNVQPGEKIGIVGRTGAGKSSLIIALFKLMPIEGNIFIDNVNLNEVSLGDLRSRLSIIPQDPVLFSGSFRKNLDPFDQFEDEVLWNALGEVQLKNVVDELPAGLNTEMSEGGSNFSVGQKQLVCLARALIRRNRILIMDEATANVDPMTDSMIQRTIKDRFSDCTVLTIAHRLHTIMDSDRVMVMEEGALVEFDHPFLLLQNSNGKFYELLNQLSPQLFKNLLKVSEEKYNMDKEHSASVEDL